MGDTDTVLSFPNTAASRRSHETLPARGDNWFVSGFRPIADFAAGTLKITHGTGLLVDSDTVYWVDADTYRGLSIPSGTSLVHYVVDADSTYNEGDYNNGGYNTIQRVTGDIQVGGSPSDPSLALARVDADAQTTTELNRTPDDVLGALDVDGIHNIEYVTEESDLPYPTNGTHTLEGSTVYYIAGFVTITDPIELGSLSPIVGSHGGTDGLIYTGGGTMLQGTDAEFFARDLLFSAPGGTLFNLSANQSTEMLVESCSFADPAGMGNMTSLGTVDGYRVPTWKGCNFEDFDGGLTFDGTPDKIAFFDSPFRTVDASGVTILTFAGTLDTDIIQIKGCYVKSVQSDTVVVDVQSGALPSETFQYLDTTHDTTVTKSNILTGVVGVETVGSRVTSSFPLKDSDVGASLDYDGSGATTITGSGSGATQITATSSATNVERFTQQSNGILEYTGRKDASTLIVANASVSGANTEFVIGLAKNGLPAAGRTETTGFTPNSTAPETVSTVGKFDLTTGDTVSLALENTGGAADLDVNGYSITA